MELFAEPFPYFTAVSGFGEQASSTILAWMEKEAPWRLVETDFYEQYEFSFSDVQVPSQLGFLKERMFLDELRSKITQIFSARLSERIDCSAHKLVTGQRIRFHNDFIPGEETHRVLIQLNRGWVSSQGGYLIFFNSHSPDDVHRVFLPVHDSVVGFAISQDSNHAVSTMHGGERFTLVLSFYGSSGSR